MTTQLFNADQRELARVVRSFLDHHSSEAQLRETMAGDLGWEKTSWTIATTQLGLAGLAIPEEYGGSGFGLVELGICFEQMGRSLYCAPLLGSTGFAANLILATGDTGACRRLLPKIASGEWVASVALHESAAPISAPSDVRTRAERNGRSWTINGRKRYVLDGHVADLILVIAHTGTEIGVFAVSAADQSAGSIVRTAVAGLDQTRRTAHIEFDEARASRIGGGDSLLHLEQAMDLARLLLAAEQVGGTARVLEMATTYARQRIQFGRAIGSYQAVKHRCADMLVRLEAARSAAYTGLQEAERGSDALDRCASLAASFC